MAGPSVVVERAPDGWTHIGGPSMHLLIALDEEDDRTLAASDAADGDDLDDVIEVLTTGGMRKARHFVGVHWKNGTRIVAFGPVVAVVTDADGHEREVRSTSARVWTDLDLEHPPEKVTIRVLDETELKQPTPPEAVTEAGASPSEPAAQPDAAEPAAAGGPGVVEPAEPTAADVAEASGALSTPPAGDPEVDRNQGQRPSARSVETPSSVEPVSPARSPTIPTFGAQREPATTDGPGSRMTASPWGRSWAKPSLPVEPATSPAPVASPPPTTPAEPAPAPASPQPPVAGSSGSGLPRWGSHRPYVVVSAPAAPPAATAAHTTPADRLGTDAPADVESTWRPSAEATPASSESGLSARAPTPASPGPHTGPEGSAAPEVAAATEHSGPPSYDYLFGHTVAAEEHRRFLADLDPADHDEDPDSPSAPDDSLTGEASPGASKPEPPTPAKTSGPAAAANPAPPARATQLPPTSGGLISSVPWASSPPAVAETPGQGDSADRSAGSTDVADSAPVPTFGGRRTPPPAPSLLPHPAPPAPPVSTSASFTVSGPPPAASPPPEPPHDEAEHEPDESNESNDGLTVDRRALTEARNAAQQSGESGPTVLAVLCVAGHPTPPHGERCRVCGAGIPTQDPFTMPRPPLGVLRLSTGDVVSLDRSVLLGRAPKLDAALTGAERPHVLKVASPERDVSRNHVEVVLEGWHVLIRDLGTTNGTTVALPGDEPVRLRANDQQVLEPGSLVSMADEITFTFEAGETA